jgi:hypothetical protein
MLIYSGEHGGRPGAVKGITVIKVHQVSMKYNKEN